MHVLITGGCGYKGTVLTGALLNDGHRVTVVDTAWFGNHLPVHDALTFVQEDVRNTERIPLEGVDAVIHLANIANDPAVELRPTMSWEVNVLATHQFADRAARAGVQQFLFASSGSVYGVKHEPDVTEDLPLVPISVYNKTKMVAERVLMSYADQMRVHIIRPATVCGWSPRMRLDLTVNVLTFQALSTGRITVFGGSQTRPNIHIQDAVRVYQHFLEMPDLPSGAYNAGFENLSVLEIAHRVSERIPAEIVVTDSDDPRSYRQNSDKLLATGFAPTSSIDDAIVTIAEKYASGELVESDQHYTVRWMKTIS